MEAKSSCLCSDLDDPAVVGMGGPNGFGARVFATLDEVREHGGNKWWLYASVCRICGQSWMVAQDERIHDNFVLKRLERRAMRAIIENGNWPDDFLRFEQVLRVERTSGKVASFFDPHDSALVKTVHDLRRERPDISVEDIAFALAISNETAAELVRL